MLLQVFYSCFPVITPLTEQINKKGSCTMKLNIYSTQTEIEKTYRVDDYDIMFGTVEDLLAVFDELDDIHDNVQMFKVITKNRSKVNELLKDVFPELTDAELRRTKLKELIPVFMELFNYVVKSMGTEKN